MSPAPRSSSRLAAFVVLCVICLAGAVGYVLQAEGRSRPALAEAAPAATLEAIGEQPHVVARNMHLGGAGGVEIASLADPDGRRAATGLSCLRVYMAGGRGLCLNNDGGLFSPFQAIFFDDQYRPVGHQTLAGVISRARVSPDGRYGATTVFVSGDSYADGTFSTRTTLFRMEDATRVADLEDFDVYRDGARIDAVDFNFWGVTFAPGVRGVPGETDSRLFYATLGTAGHTYLLKGDVDARRLDVVRDGVECPSLSPDGTRLAFKSKIGSDDGGPIWRPAVLDLATLEDHVLAEDNNIDDQIEWLDNDTVVYAVDSGEGAPDTYAALADGSGASRVFLTDADSPAVIRG